MKAKTTTILSLVILMMGSSLAHSQNLNVRNFITVNDVALNGVQDEDVLFYQTESVQYDIHVRRGNKKVAFTSTSEPVWRAWLASDVSTLLINVTGTVQNAGSGHARITLTPTQSNIATGAYESVVQMWDGTTYHGTIARSQLLVEWSPNSASYATAPGVPSTVYLVAGDVLEGNMNAGGYSITGLNAVTSTGIVSAASLKSDTVAESTSSSGVTIDSVLLKDGDITIPSTDFVGIGAALPRIAFTDTTIDQMDLLAANVRIGAVTPDTATAVNDLVVLGMIEAQGSGGIMAYSASANPSVTLDREGSDTWDMQNVSGVFHIYNSTDAGSRLSIDAGDGDVTVANDLKVDLIHEKTGAAGVTIDSLKIKDGILVGTPYANKVVATHGATDDPTFPDAGIIADGDFVDLIWDTEVSDVDDVLDSGGTEIQFTRTGWAVITMSYQVECNNNSLLYYRLLEDTTEYMQFQELTARDAPEEGFFVTVQIPITDASKVYKFQAAINTSDGSTDYPTGQGCRLHIILWPDA